jgi:hypothetical protein
MASAALRKIPQDLANLASRGFDLGFATRFELHGDRLALVTPLPAALGHLGISARTIARWRNWWNRTFSQGLGDLGRVVGTPQERGIRAI